MVPTLLYGRHVLVVVFFVLIFPLSHSIVMAVDRSKFRTCEQTSFCRRHRHDKHGSLFEYKLLPETMHFHFEKPGDVQEEKVPDAGEEKQSTEGVWQSLQRRFLGKSHGDGKSSGRDVYVRGPSPTLTGRLQNVGEGSSAAQPIYEQQLEWSVTALQSGLVRMRVTEVYEGPGALPSDIPARVTYDELVLEVEQLHHAGHAVWLRPGDDVDRTSLLGKIFKQRGIGKSDYSKYSALQYGDSADESDPSRMILLIKMEPFAVLVYRESSISSGPIVELSTDQMMHFEVRQLKHEEGKEAEAEHTEEPNEEQPVETEKEIVGYWEDGLAIYADGTREEKKAVVEEETHRQLTEAELDQEGLWEEKFGSHTDSKPHGPMSVGMDISFPSSKHLYGIPEHAASAVLQATTGEDAHFKEPYRLYNLDVFEYELDETMALYGEVPLVVSQSATTGSVGVFWFNPSETFVDVATLSDRTKTHWMSESGILDIFVMPGPDPSTLYKQYGFLTGTTPLPPMFSLGYHQCRWNYKDEKDVAMVHSKFEELDYPYDVLWLDIEHTDGKRYFTWDKNLFPNPKEMQQNLAAQGRRMVTIVDPHIKRDDKYYIHKEATSKGLYIKDKDGVNDYDGWCWPGSSSYLDFTADHVRSWWADQFAYNKYEGSTPTLFTWNDMNEPSVFNGPEVSMQKDLRNLKGEEHREWHNLYGMLFHRATAEGQIRRNKPNQDVRPFVLSRSFFAGSQKYGAIWTGDNTAEWEHLVVAAPMLLNLNTAALSFVGADVGGFFGNPDAELFTRWMQAGAYQPFFRGHAHHDSKRREPWMFDDETLVRLRRAAMTRYSLLPFWYTVFYNAETTGMPVMRMMWMQYPKTEATFSLDDQYLIGEDLLVKPVTAEGVEELEVIFPTDHLWYDVQTMVKVSAAVKPNKVFSKIVPSDIDTIPVFQRGGSIIPRKLRLRRSAMMMKTDPYTLFVALDDKYRATGNLHMDDEETFGYRNRSEFADATFTADFNNHGTLHNSVVVGSGWQNYPNLGDDRMIERIVVMGLPKPPSKLVVKETGNNLDFSYDATKSILVIRKPELSAIHEWTVDLL